MNDLQATVKAAMDSGLISMPEPRTPKKKTRTTASASQILKLAMRGMSQKEIAIRTGQHASSVSQTINRYGRLRFVTFEEWELLMKTRGIKK